MSSAYPAPVDQLFPPENAEEAWAELRLDYKRFEIFACWTHQPIYNNIGLIVRHCPNALLHILLDGRVAQAVDNMKALSNFITTKGFMCEDPQAMNCLSEAIEQASQGNSLTAIDLIRQFQLGTILGLEYATDEQFEEYRAVLQASHFTG